jgi:exodeoxyribonuclease VII large subunit
VSAIGHEADRPLLDEVADLRASTPTDAAKRVVPDVSEELNRVEQARARLSLRITAFIRHEVDRIEQVRTRPVMVNPAYIVDSRAEDLTRYVSRGVELLNRELERAQNTTSELSARLRALSPQSTLDRGYAIVQADGGHIVRQVPDAPPGSALTITLARGAVAAQSLGEHSPLLPSDHSSTGGAPVNSRD